MAGLKIATDTNIFPLQINEVKQSLRELHVKVDRALSRLGIG